MTESPEHIAITPMTVLDVPQVYAIERRSFTSPWDIESYYGELRNPATLYLVARAGERILGFGGMWVVENEGHIVTLAVHPDCRRRGIGRQLLRVLLEKARQRQVMVVTLEVRVGNIAAQALYTAFGFRIIAHRRHYYPDNGEDAAVMGLDLRQTDTNSLG